MRRRGRRGEGGRGAEGPRLLTGHTHCRSSPQSRGGEGSLVLESHLPHLGALPPSLRSLQQGTPVLDRPPPEVPTRPQGPGRTSCRHPHSPLVASLGRLASFKPGTVDPGHGAVGRLKPWPHAALGGCPTCSRCPKTAQPIV